MFGFRKREHANHVPGTVSTDGLKLPAYVEFELIKKLLEQKFRTPFAQRVKLDGYIDAPKYRLVLDNYKTATRGNMVSVYGGESESVLDLYDKFIEKYWGDFRRFSGKDPNSMDLFDRTVYDNWLNTAVSGSREEFLLNTAAGGMI